MTQIKRFIANTTQNIVIIRKPFVLMTKGFLIITYMRSSMIFLHYTISCPIIS